MERHTEQKSHYDWRASESSNCLGSIPQKTAANNTTDRTLKQQSNIRDTKKLGQGGNGLVLYSTGTNTVLKLCDKTTLDRYLQLLKEKTTYPKEKTTNPKAATFIDFLTTDKYFTSTKISDDKRQLEMAYVDGLDLKTIFLQMDRTEPLDPSIITYILSHSLVALDRLHQAGFVHHDLKPDNMMIGINLQLIIIDYDHVKKVDKNITKDFGTVGFIRYQLDNQNFSLSKLSTRNKNKSHYSSKEEDYFALGMTVFLLMVAPWETNQIKLMDRLNSTSSFNAYCRESSYDQWLVRLKQVYRDYWTEHASKVSSVKPTATQAKQPDESIFKLLAMLFDYNPSFAQQLLEKQASLSEKPYPQQLIDEMHAAVIPHIIGVELKQLKDSLVRDFESKRRELVDQLMNILSPIDLKNLGEWFNKLYDNSELENDWSAKQMIYFVVYSLIQKVEYRIKTIVLKMDTTDEQVFLKVNTTIRYKQDQKVSIVDVVEHKFVPEVIEQTQEKQRDLMTTLEKIHGKDNMSGFEQKNMNDQYTSASSNKTGKYEDGTKVIQETMVRISKLYDDLYDGISVDPGADWDFLKVFYTSLPDLMKKMIDMMELLSDKVSMSITMDERRIKEYFQKRYNGYDYIRFSNHLMKQLKVNNKIHASDINCESLQRFAKECFSIDHTYRSSELRSSIDRIRGVMKATVK